MVVLRIAEPYLLATEITNNKTENKNRNNIKNETAMKKYNDKVKRIIMNNGNSMEVKYKSELLEQIRHDFEIMENESSDIDPGFFTEDDVWSLYEFLLMRHRDDWYVIDDMDDEEEEYHETEDSYYEEKEEYYYEEERTDDDERGR
jgi:hypothetical protein